MLEGGWYNRILENMLNNDNHSKHAKRFMDFKFTLDQIEDLSEIKVDKIMKEAIKLNRYKDKNNRCPIISLLKDRDDYGNTRKGVPATILNAIQKYMNEYNAEFPWNPPKRAKVPHTWFVCYVYNIFPDQNIADWEYYQCSHLCTNGECITQTHLHWEDAATNQSRGNLFCRRKCKHGDCKEINVCACQVFHNPHCI